MDISPGDLNFEISLIEAIGNGLPIVSRPYQEIARQIGSTEAKVITGIQRIVKRGDIKRFGVVVRHRELGYRANGMVVWDIPDDAIQAFGHHISQYDFVTLCYRRPRRLPDWPYNLFCMIHGHNQADVCRHVDLIVKECDLKKATHQILFSNRCFKQRGANYRQQSKLSDEYSNQHQAVANG